MSNEGKVDNTSAKKQLFTGDVLEHLIMFVYSNKAKKQCGEDAFQHKEKSDIFMEQNFTKRDMAIAAEAQDR